MFHARFVFTEKVHYPHRQKDDVCYNYPNILKLNTMITSRPNIDPKGRYGVVDTAKLLGIHRSTLWRWVEKLDSTCNPTSE